SDPHRDERLAVPGLLAWPVALSGDGRRWAATAEDGHVCAVENGEVLARFDRLEGPWVEAAGGGFVWRGSVDGKQPYLGGRMVTEPFGDVTFPEFIPGGSWHVLGSDPQGTHLVVDGQRVADRGPGAHAVRAQSGQVWAWRLREADGLRVVHDDRTYGPYPESPGVFNLTL